MTQVKKASKATKKAAKMQKMPSMAEMYRNFSKDQQEAIITFFNLHNASTFLFNQMDEKVQDYCRYCIELSQEAAKETDVIDA